ncbi:Caspase domain-containing protein [Burkholderia sp. YR290]|nr:Caspase domain-containing protein [Burkholderia sp. YR290]
MSTRNLYALLIGVNEYPAPVPSLNGCVNDIEKIKALLKERAATGDLCPNVKVLLNEEAKRQAIIDGFLNHLSLAGKDDVVLFYFSGHGSQEHTPPELWHLEPDRLDETLVCYDSRLAGGYDLADKEIARLLANVASKDPHIVVILDCCHSGSGTRAPVQLSDAKVRRVPTDLRERPITSFFVPPGQEGGQRSDTVGETQPRPRHVLMAACREDEEAKETTGDGTARGLFSFRLLEAITSARGDITYRDLYKRVNALVRAGVAHQSPVIEVTEISDLDRSFLGGALQPHAPYFTVSFDKNIGWMIDGGAVHGIAPPVGAETTILAIHPTSLEIDGSTRLDKPIAEARVTKVLPSSAAVTLAMNQGEADPKLTYRGVVVSVPLPAVRVQISGEEGAVALVRKALAHAAADGKPSLLIAEAAEHAALRLQANANGYSIIRAGDDRSLRVEVSQVSEATAGQAVQRLEHIARWMRLAELRNPATRLSAGAVGLDVFFVSEGGKECLLDPAIDGADLRFAYVERDGELVPPKFKIRLRNNSRRRLYFMLLDLPETYGVFSSLLPGNGAWLNPGEEVWAETAEGNTIIEGSVPIELREQGVTEIKDTLKVIASTVECDATLLDQEDLDVQAESRLGAKRTLPSNTLEQLFYRVQTRHYAGTLTSAVADWTTLELSTTIVCAQRGVPVPAKGQVQLAPGVRLKGHSQLKAVARLSRDTTTSRDAELDALPPLPPWLIDDPNVVTAFEFSSERGGDTGLSTLYLEEVAEWGTVTKENPLVLQVDRPLVEDDAVLPVGFDGEFFVPLGWAEGREGLTEIHLEILPQPLVNKRSLKGSIRIFFRKVSWRWLGTQYEYPLLARVKAGPGEDEVTYVTDLEQIRGAVEAARRIVLYVHGIIGDTRAMAQSAFIRPSGIDTTIPLMSDRYDLVLAFDYENLNTSIEQTARDLKQRLEDIGLGNGHGKELHIVAHSMGGLVSRWFIEREGGHTLVQHLIMLGTPNSGSPWPAVGDLVKTLIGIGLNNLSKIPWPPTVLGSLMRISTRIGATLVKVKGPLEATLAEMNPDSPFLDALRQSPDPGVQYSIIAGNTSLISLALDAEHASSGRLERLLERITPQNILHKTTAIAFFGAPNDIAVSVTAIGAVPTQRVPPPFVREAACDHLSYFGTEAGLRGLAAVQAGRADPVYSSKQR